MLSAHSNKHIVCLWSFQKHKPHVPASSRLFKLKSSLRVNTSFGRYFLTDDDKKIGSAIVIFIRIYANTLPKVMLSEDFTCGTPFMEIIRWDTAIYDLLRSKKNAALDYLNTKGKFVIERSATVNTRKLCINPEFKVTPEFLPADYVYPPAPYWMTPPPLPLPPSPPRPRRNTFIKEDARYWTSTPAQDGIAWDTS